MLAVFPSKGKPPVKICSPCCDALLGSTVESCLRLGLHLCREKMMGVRW